MISGVVAQYQRKAIKPSQYPTTILHFNGAEGGVVFEEDGGRPVVRVGTAVTTTQASPAMGDACAVWPPTLQTSLHYLQLPLSSDYSMGLGPFTIEFFFKTTAVAASPLRVLSVGNTFAGCLQIWQAAADAAYGTPQGITLANRGSSGPVVDSKKALNDGAWHWVVVQRAAGNVFSMYVDGVLTQTVTMVMAYDEPNPILRIGASAQVTPTAASLWRGSIDELRITKGIARYSGATIPVPTQPFVYGD